MNYRTVLPTPMLPGSGEEETERQRDKQDEIRVIAALSGRVSEQAKQVIERRCKAVANVTGWSWTELRKRDPRRYRRFLRGSVAAMLREKASRDGDRE